MSDRKTGTVKWYNNQKRFGFIAPHDGSGDIFVEQSSIVGNGIRSLAEGQVVSFVIGGNKAQDVRSE